MRRDAAVADWLLVEYWGENDPLMRHELHRDQPHALWADLINDRGNHLVVPPLGIGELEQATARVLALSNRAVRRQPTTDLGQLKRDLLYLREYRHAAVRGLGGIREPLCSAVLRGIARLETLHLLEQNIATQLMAEQGETSYHRAILQCLLEIRPGERDATAHRVDALAMAIGRMYR